MPKLLEVLLALLIGSLICLALIDPLVLTSAWRGL